MVKKKDVREKPPFTTSPFTCLERDVDHPLLLTPLGGRYRVLFQFLVVSLWLLRSASSCVAVQSCRQWWQCGGSKKAQHRGKSLGLGRASQIKAMS